MEHFYCQLVLKNTFKMPTTVDWQMEIEFNLVSTLQLDLSTKKRFAYAVTDVKMFIIRGILPSYEVLRF